LAAKLSFFLIPPKYLSQFGLSSANFYRIRIVIRYLLRYRNKMISNEPIKFILFFLESKKFDFTFLALAALTPKREHFYIGYNVTEQTFCGLS
jgi:hypothetical protein